MSVSGPSNQNQTTFSQIIQDELYYDERCRGKNDEESLYIDTGNLLPQEMSNFYSLNFPNLSAVSASECNVQSFTTISSGIAPEAELADDKEANASTKDLVLAAISVMKGRKARPDTKRICNWVNRKYGRSVTEVVQEIDDLCQQAILEKVDYKGSISFRVTSEKKLHKRVGRRKNSNQDRPGQDGIAPTSEPSAQKSPRPPSPKKSPRPGGGGSCSGKTKDGQEKMDPVTLNLLLREEINVDTDGLVTKENIVKALELTKRPINKRAVYRDLETILAHEIHLGYLVKLAENSFTLASINKDKHYRGTIPLKSSKRKPKPTQKLLEMEADLQKNKQDKYSDYVTFDSEGNFPFFLPGGGGGGGGGGSIISPNKSEEELKDDLIKEKLINSNLLKIKSKMKSGKGKTKRESSAAPQQPPLSSPSVTTVALTGPPELTPPTPETTVTLKDREEKKSVLVPIKPKFKKETWQVSITVKESKSRAALTPPRTTQPVVVPRPPPPPQPSLSCPPPKPCEPALLVKEEEKVNQEGEGDEEEEDGEEEEVGGTDEEPKLKRSSRKRKQVSEENEEEEVAANTQDTLTTRALSGRKKRARKIFDPADHDIPSRMVKKWRTDSPTSEAQAYPSPGPEEEPGRSPAPETGLLQHSRLPDLRSQTREASPSSDGISGQSTQTPLTNGSRRSKEGRRAPVRAEREAGGPTKPVKVEEEEEEDEGGANLKDFIAPPKPMTRRKSTECQAAAAVKRSAEPAQQNAADKNKKRCEEKPSKDRTQMSRESFNGTDKTSVPKKDHISSKKESPATRKESISAKKESVSTKKDSIEAAPAPKSEKAACLRKAADHAAKVLTPSDSSINKAKKDATKEEETYHSSTKQSIVAAVGLREKGPGEKAATRLKPEPVDAEPTFKVPAPKKPLSRPASADRHQKKLSGSKSKPTATKASAGVGSSGKKPGLGGSGGGKPVAATKSVGRSTRASTLTASLRAKRDLKQRALCTICNTGNKKNEKLITCKDCNKIVHPSCLNYPEDLTDRIYKQAWQCIDCKVCFACNLAGNDDKMLFCDSCDLGYHMSCHRPPISRKPRGRWECDTCAAETGYKGETDEKFLPPGAATFFEELVPALPPGVGPWPALGFNGQFCPAPDQYPPNWQDLPCDESIPDISGWSPARMSQYLVQNGIKDTAAKVFFDQEIDGASALVLQRQDVLKGLGLKLGPALKIFHHIKRLQTRRNLGLVA